MGEENSKFFQAMVAERFRRNTISGLINDDGLSYSLSSHNAMAGLLWSSYKDRMGVSYGIDMLFDLEDLIQPVPGLESLSEPFSDEEINEVLKHLPQDIDPDQMGLLGCL